MEKDVAKTSVWWLNLVFNLHRIGRRLCNPKKMINKFLPPPTLGQPTSDVPLIPVDSPLALATSCYIVFCDVFPQQRKLLGSSAIVKVSEQSGAAQKTIPPGSRIEVAE